MACERVKHTYTFLTVDAVKKKLTEIHRKFMASKFVLYIYFCRLFSLLREVFHFLLQYLPLVLTLLQFLTNGSHTYFPKFSPSSSVSGSSVLAVSGSKIHSIAPNNGPSPKVSGGTKKPSVFCKSNRQKFQNS